MVNMSIFKITEYMVAKNVSAVHENTITLMLKGKIGIKKISTIEMKKY